MLRRFPLLAFQESTIAVKETEMLELETLFMLVNTVLREYGPRCLKNGRSAI